MSNNRIENILVKSKFVEMFGGKKDTETVNSCCNFITKGTTPTTLGFNFVNQGINFIKVENIIENNISNKNFMKISNECNQMMSRSQLHENDIIFSIAGTLGKVAIVNSDVLPANTNQALAIIRCNENKIDYRYLYYALQQEKIRTQISDLKVSSNRDNLSLENIGDFQIYLPNKEETKLFLDFVEHIDKLKFDDYPSINNMTFSTKV